MSAENSRKATGRTLEQLLEELIEELLQELLGTVDETSVGAPIGISGRTSVIFFEET